VRALSALVPLSLFENRVIVERVTRSLRRVNVLGWLVVALVAVLAEVAVRLFDLQDSVAAPSATLRALSDGLVSGTLSGELVTTLEGFAQGLAVAVAVGVALGLLIGSSRTLLDASLVLIEFLRPIPAVAFIPVAILYFGLDTPMRRWVVAYAAVWPILVNTIYGVRATDRLLHDVARTSGVTRVGRLAYVSLPASLPSVATGLRVSASIGLLVCVTAEFLTGSGGLGSYMREQQFAFRLPEMYAAVVLVGALGYAVNVALRATERRVVFWVGEERTAG
jgi:ABC-type nitrate/sulfonate/bicarbonate transport system permease component